MGLRQVAYDYILESVKMLGKKNICMVELGNQIIKLRGKYKGPSKPHFQKMGIKHISLDLNGKDGAIAVDLSKPLKKFYDISDITTNCGTVEHIPDGQEVAFANVHRMTKCGGYMIHVQPLIGHWSGHCPHKYTESFIDKLAEDNGYKVLRKEIVPTPSIKRDLIHSLLQKVNDNPFVVSENWLKEITFTSSYKHNSDNLK